MASVGAHLGVVLVFAADLSVGAALAAVAAGTAGIGFLASRRRAVAPVKATTFVLLVLLYISVAVPLVGQGSVGVSADLRLSSDQLSAATLTLAFVILGLVGGATVTAQVLRSPRAAPDRFAGFSISYASPAFVVAALAPVLLIGVSDGGYGALIRRPTYLMGDGTDTATILSSALSLPGFAAVAFLGVAAPRVRIRRFATVASLLYCAVFFSWGSRRFALAVGVLIAVHGLKRSRNLRLVSLVLAALATALALQLPITYRQLPEHGLIPYAEALRGGTAVGGNGLALLVNSFGFSYPLAAEVIANQPSVGARDFWISVNPAPGSLSGWRGVQYDHLVNPSTPMSGLGELGQLGVWWAGATAAGFGAALAGAAHLVGRRAGRSGRLVILGLTGIAGMFGLQLVQYSLRSATRLVWYALVIAALTALAGPLLDRRLGRGRAS